MAAGEQVLVEETFGVAEVAPEESVLQLVQDRFREASGLPARPGRESAPESETYFSMVGLRFMDDSKGERLLYHGADRIAMGKTTLRVFEVVSLYPEGLEFGRLHRKINTLTGGKASAPSLKAHLDAIDEAFVTAGLPYWKQSVRQGRDGNQRRHYKVEGAVPRHPSTWPDYLAPIRPRLDGLENRFDAEAWKQYAACQTVDGDAFFPEKGATGLWVGRMACSMCTVREDCLEWESQFEKQENSVNFMHGLYAGLTHRDRFAAYRIAESEGEAAADAYISEKQSNSDRLARNALWVRIRPNQDQSRKAPFTMDDIIAATRAAG